MSDTKKVIEELINQRQKIKELWLTQGVERAKTKELWDSLGEQIKALKESKPTPLTPKGWSLMAEDTHGWLSEKDVQNLRTKETGERFNHMDDRILVSVPQGKFAAPIGGLKEAQFELPQKAEAVHLEFDLSIDGPRHKVGGKLLGFSGGGGAGGGHVAGVPDVQGGARGGWSARILAGSASDGRGGRTQGLRLYLYPQNREELGARRSGSDNRLFGKSAFSWRSSLKEGFNKIGLTIVTNTPQTADGAAILWLNGKQSARVDNIMWQADPEFIPVDKFYWAHMFGGSWRKLPAPDDIVEQYMNFKIFSCDRESALSNIENLVNR